MSCDHCGGNPPKTQVWAPGALVAYRLCDNRDAADDCYRAVYTGREELGTRKFISAPPRGPFLGALQEAHLARRSATREDATP